MYFKNEQEANTHISHLIPLVGDNSCGPESSEDLWNHIMAQGDIASQNRECRVISYAGNYDILVYPNRTFSLIPNTGVIKYKLIELG